MDLHSLTTNLGQRLIARTELITCAESCTGGWLAKIFTDVAGSSTWFERGFVTYSNLSKQQMLGVSEQTLDQHGAVSAQTVAEMAAGALSNSVAHYAIAISGIAGPGGGSAEKPVGTVFMGLAARDREGVEKRFLFSGGRDEVRLASVHTALTELLQWVR